MVISHYRTGLGVIGENRDVRHIHQHHHQQQNFHQSDHSETVSTPHVGNKRAGRETEKKLFDPRPRSMSSARHAQGVIIIILIITGRNVMRQSTHRRVSGEKVVSTTGCERKEI
jgi:hypothetical protein